VIQLLIIDLIILGKRITFPHELRARRSKLSEKEAESGQGCGGKMGRAANSRPYAVGA